MNTALATNMVIAIAGQTDAAITEAITTVMIADAIKKISLAGLSVRSLQSRLSIYLSPASGLALGSSMPSKRLSIIPWMFNLSLAETAAARLVHSDASVSLEWAG